MKVGICFAGQGVQYPSMIHDIYANFPIAKEVFDLANSALKRDIASICFYGSADELNITHNTQPCILAADLAVWEVLKSFRIKATGYAGFSLGEYAALTAVGCISTKEVFPIVQARADAMQEAVSIGKGLMLAVLSKETDKILSLIRMVSKGYLSVSNYNCPGQLVLSGEAMAVREFKEYAKAERIRCVELPVSVPVHCDLMLTAAERFNVLLSVVKINKPTANFYMNVDGYSTDDINTIRVNLVRQMVKPVLWQRTVLEMWKDGIDTFIECGPGKTLSGFIRRTVPTANILQVNDMASLQNTLKALGV